MKNVDERVKKIIADQLHVDLSKVTDNANLRDDLGADEASFSELILALEMQFKVEIPEEEAQKIKRVRDVVKYIETHAKQHAYAD